MVEPEGAKHIVVLVCFVYEQYFMYVILKALSDGVFSTLKRVNRY